MNLAVMVGRDSHLLVLWRNLAGTGLGRLLRALILVTPVVSGCISPVVHDETHLQEVNRIQERLKLKVVYANPDWTVPFVLELLRYEGPRDSVCQELAVRVREGGYDWLSELLPRQFVFNPAGDELTRTKQLEVIEIWYLQYKRDLKFRTDERGYSLVD